MNVKTNSDKASEDISSPFGAAAQEEEPALELISSTIGGTATRSETETESIGGDIEQAARSYTLHLFETLPVYVFLAGAGVDLLNKLGITTADIEVLKSLTSKPTTDHLKTQIQKHVMHKKDELISAERALNEAHNTMDEYHKVMTEGLEQFKKIEAEETELHKEEEEEIKAAVAEIMARYKEQKKEASARKTDVMAQVNLYAQMGSNEHLIVGMEASKDSKAKEHEAAYHFAEVLQRAFAAGVPSPNQPRNPFEYCGAVIPLNLLGEAFFKGLATVQKELGQQVMDPENFVVDAGSLTHYTKILRMANNTGIACNHGYFDYNGQKFYLPANRLRRESKKAMFVRVMKTLTHRDVILSPFVMKMAGEDLNEERERQRLREESSSQSTTPTRNGKRGFGGLDMESIAQAKTLYDSNKKARVSLVKKQSPDNRDNNVTARTKE